MSTEEREDSEVEEADGRGESEGETAAEDSESVAAVVEVTVLLRTGLLGTEAPEEAVAEAIAGVVESLAKGRWDEGFSTADQTTMRG